MCGECVHVYEVGGVGGGSCHHMLSIHKEARKHTVRKIPLQPPNASKETEKVVSFLAGKCEVSSRCW